MQTSPGAAVVLLGPPGSGKSTLARAVLSSAGGSELSGAPSRLAVGTYERDGAAVWLLDPPGAPDLAGELAAAVRVASAAVLVVSPVQGLDPRSAALWEALEHLPRLVVLSQLDRPGADADDAVALCQRLLGETVLPLQLPLHDDDGSVGGVLDLLHLSVSAGGERRAADPEHATLVEGVRAELLEAVLTGSEDEELFEEFLAGAEPPAAALDAELEGAVARGDLQPVLVTVPRRGVGLAELAALLARLPGAAPVPAAVDADGVPPPDGALVAEAVRPGLLRVWSGELRPGPVLVDGLPATYAGRLVGDGALVEAGLGDHPGAVVTSATGAALVLAPWDVPPPGFPVGAPDDPALAARVRADGAARLEPDARTGQLLLWTHGPEHAELLLAGLPSSPVRLPPGNRPVRVTVRVPEWAARAVRRDLVARQAEVVEEQPDDRRPGWLVLSVRLPPAELPGYALALSRASSATGWFSLD